MTALIFAALPFVMGVEWIGLKPPLDPDISGGNTCADFSNHLRCVRYAHHLRDDDAHFAIVATTRLTRLIHRFVR
ncbi:hypothetical protein [Paraburkholderia silvatlantica]|uniref:hypothetical protein n=1 Tax=Paraburkholderia silvatlantica TaxID=321895 RepID=UPI0011B4C732|nr:hypothetical protein [Paraburkholderia silvatlantica]